jgi:hypothetical protein
VVRPRTAHSATLAEPLRPRDIDSGRWTTASKLDNFVLLGTTGKLHAASATIVAFLKRLRLHIIGQRARLSGDCSR